MFSPLVRAMFLVNLVGPAFLLAGLLYLEGYEEELIQSEIGVLKAQATLVAESLGESASRERGGAGGPAVELDETIAKRLVSRFASPDGARVRVYAPGGALLIDSRRVLGAGGLIQIEPLPPPEPSGGFEKLFNDLHDVTAPIWERFVRGRPLYTERPDQTAIDYPETIGALAGDTEGAIRRLPTGQLILSAAAPTRRFKQVIGAVMLTQGGERVTAAVRAVRYNILRLFFGAMCLSFLATLYLARAISRPLRALADAADEARRETALDKAIPDFSNRRDEIGDLSLSLREMAAAIQARITAIERFAADVAHEIKNPLTSLKSAVETVGIVKEDAQRARLLEVIQHDVERLDRLISDISDASRLDAELSREETETVDLAGLLATLVDIETTSAAGDRGAPRIRFETASSASSDGLGGQGPAAAKIQGMEGRLAQVFRNLIGNARSFSPPGGRIDVRLARLEDRFLVTVEDEGHGIPPGKEEAIFERFYTERPVAESFGDHSGLGLSISRQIVEAHKGTLWAENRLAPQGEVMGARFVVSLPAPEPV